MFNGQENANLAIHRSKRPEDSAIYLKLAYQAQTSIRTRCHQIPVICVFLNTLMPPLGCAALSTGVVPPKHLRRAVDVTSRHKAAPVVFKCIELGQAMECLQSSYLTSVTEYERPEQTVSTVVQRLDDLESSKLWQANQDEPITQAELRKWSTKEGLEPLFLLREVTTKSGFLPRDQTTANTPPRGLSDSLVLKQLINEQDTGGYHLTHRLRRILFSKTYGNLVSHLAPKLFREANPLLSTAMLGVLQPIEFFQASLVPVAEWLRFSAQYCQAIPDGGDIGRCRLIPGSDHATNFELRIVLEVHSYQMIYRSCSSTADLPRTTSRAIGVEERVDILAWYGPPYRRNFFACAYDVTDQPRSQFVPMGFHFAQRLVYNHASITTIRDSLLIKSHSAAVHQLPLSEIVYLSTAIIKISIDTADERTRHLTYHIINFEAVTPRRLLRAYEDQLSPSRNFHRRDGLTLPLSPRFIRSFVRILAQIEPIICRSKFISYNMTIISNSEQNHASSKPSPRSQEEVQQINSILVMFGVLDSLFVFSAVPALTTTSCRLNILNFKFGTMVLFTSILGLTSRTLVTSKSTMQGDNTGLKIVRDCAAVMMSALFGQQGPGCHLREVNADSKDVKLLVGAEMRS
ncbi:uncharacterized protein BDR25DRAFT_358587 [Lindgomyces ingoldianus]|uniref:Uncharacterized protein n=1 Tax=Lindgomyces ingoldianus TaxID=673940 RepID=A0ACB6QKP4_9PLEO|nr:uncharacterized protein BDR25DRAFT_358587 [Lindgomyces ingoldianus]KAF2467475.1 hypothetical protein BDR25DRAFT_358587 [Lindgomyces ingoldianus]